MRPRISLLLAFLPTLLVPTLAQRRDLKLSPPEPVTRVLPDTIRIQAANRYGDLALVVWGSNRRLSDGTHVTCLWAALTRDSMQVGAPFLIHPDNARPARLVDVSAQRDRFVVTWMDSRADAPGIYAAVVDTSGLIVRPAMRIADVTSADLMRTFESGVDEHVLVWTSRGRTLAQRLTAGGSPLGVVDTLGTRITWLRRMTRAIDGWLLHVDNARRFAVGRRIDGIRPVTAPVCEPYVVRDDEAVVTVCNDTVRVFASLFESTAMRERPVPMVDSLKLILGIPAVAGDTIMVLGLTRRDSSRNYQERLHRVRLEGDLAMAHDTVMLRMSRPYGDRDGVRGVAGSGVIRVRGCENTYRIDASIYVTSAGYHDRDETTLWTTSYILDGSGLARSGGDSTVTSCEPVPLRRTSFDTVSAISAAGAELSVATVLTAWNRPQRSPALDLRKGEVRLIWVQDGATPFMMRRWPDRGDTVTTPVDSMIPPRIGRIGNYELDYWSSNTLNQSFGRAAVIAHHTRRDELRQGDNVFPANYTRLSVHTAGTAGWRRTVLAEGGGDHRRMDVWPLGISNDPVRAVATGGFTYAFPEEGVSGMFVVYSIDSSGELMDSLWIARGPQYGTRVLSNGAGRYLVCEAPMIRHARRGGIDTIVYFERIVSGAAFQRLHTDKVLRWWRDSVDPRRVLIERYEPDGAASGRSEFMLWSATGEVVLAETSDGTLLFVHADTSIDVHRVAPDLTPMGAPMRLTEPGAIARQPSAVVLGDTLIVVWEDWRNAGVDIYGTTVAVADIRAHVSPERTAAPRLLEHVSPMPARDMLDVMLAAPSLETTRLELVDARGAIRARGSIEPGRTRASIALDDCPSGLYVLVARSGERLENSRVIVTR